MRKYAILGGVEGAKPQGLIDTIGAGFALTNGHLALISIPILADLILWLGPKLSAQPLIQPLLEGSVLETAEASTAANEAVAALSTVNIISLLTVHLPGVLGFEGMAATADSATATISSWVPALLMGALLLAAGVFLSTLYLGGIAHALRQSPFNPDDYIASLGPSWRRLASYLLLLAGAFLILGPLVTVPIVLLGALSPSLGSLATLAALIALVVALIYLFFGDAAIFISDAKPIEAIRASVRVVQSAFWPAVGLFAVIKLIELGMGIIWVRVEGAALGMMAAILINSYVATGLIAAIMIYYQERSSWTHLSAGGDVAVQAEVDIDNRDQPSEPPPSAEHQEQS